MTFEKFFIFLSLMGGLMAFEGFAKPDLPHVSEEAWTKTATRATPLPRRTHADIRIRNLLNETDLEVEPATLHLIARAPFHHGFLGHAGRPWKVKFAPYSASNQKN